MLPYLHTSVIVWKCLEVQQDITLTNVTSRYINMYSSECQKCFCLFVKGVWFKGLFLHYLSLLSSLPLDPIKTAQGSLSLKAYRLTPKLMEICKEKDFTPEAWVAQSKTHTFKDTVHMSFMITCTHQYRRSWTNLAFAFVHIWTCGLAELTGIHN